MLCTTSVGVFRRVTTYDLVDRWDRPDPVIYSWSRQILYLVEQKQAMRTTLRPIAGRNGLRVTYVAPTERPELTDSVVEVAFVKVSLSVCGAVPRSGSVAMSQHIF